MISKEAVLAKYHWRFGSGTIELWHGGVGDPAGGVFEQKGCLGTASRSSRSYTFPAAFSLSSSVHRPLSSTNKLPGLFFCHKPRNG